MSRTRLFNSRSTSVLLSKTMLVLGLTVFGYQGVQAQETKIGFVSIDRIFRDAAPARAAQTKLENDFRGRNAELESLAGRLRSLSANYDKDKAKLSEQERARRQREIGDLDVDFQRKRREFQEDLGQRRNEELGKVLDRANQVIKDIAEKDGYDLILQEAVTVSPRVDITDKVINALNAK